MLEKVARLINWLNIRSHIHKRNVSKSLSIELVEFQSRLFGLLAYNPRYLFKNSGYFSMKISYIKLYLLIFYQLNYFYYCSKIVELEEELRVVGNNLKSLEVSEEKVNIFSSCITITFYFSVDKISPTFSILTSFNIQKCFN